MSSANTNTGASDPTYDLVSTLYHALESASTYDKYIQDAQQSGDQQLVQFFQKAQSDNRQCADQAKQLLGQKLGGQSNGQSQSQGQGSNMSQGQNQGSNMSQGQNQGSSMSQGAGMQS